jgi:hypothetical protein
MIPLLSDPDGADRDPVAKVELAEGLTTIRAFSVLL